MCSGRETEHKVSNRMCGTHRESPSVCDADGFGDRPSKQQCEEWEGDVGKMDAKGIRELEHLL